MQPPILRTRQSRRTSFAGMFNRLKTKNRPLYLKTQFVPRNKHYLGYKNQSVYVI